MVYETDVNPKFDMEKRYANGSAIINRLNYNFEDLITQQPLIYGTSRTMFETEQFINTCIWVPIKKNIQDDSQTHD